MAEISEGFLKSFFAAALCDYYSEFLEMPSMCQEERDKAGVPHLCEGWFFSNNPSGDDCPKLLLPLCRICTLGTQRAGTSFRCWLDVFWRLEG